MLAAVLLRSATLFLAGCEAPAPPVFEPPEVVVQQPTRRRIVEWDLYTGRLEAVESVEVRPRVSGYLDSVHFAEGEIVERGDLLFRIDARPYEAELREAEANLKVAESQLGLAKKTFERADTLLASRAISREDAETRQSNLQQSEAKVAQAQARVDAARLQVEFTEIRAPIAGRVGRELIAEGNLVNGAAGTQASLLTTIVSLDPIYAYFDADERSYLKYVRLAREGQRPSSRDTHNPVQVRLADEADFLHRGYMDFVDNQLDRSTGTIVGRARLPNSDHTLTPGMFVELRLPGSGEYEAVLIRPEAISFDQSRHFVYVIDEGNAARYRAVEIGPVIDGLRIVREGVTPEDRVVVAGTQRVRPGVVVRPVEASERPD